MEQNRLQPGIKTGRHASNFLDQSTDKSMLTRMQTVFLLIAVMATPPEPVTSVSAQAKDQCHGMCCPARSAHSATEQRRAQASNEKRISCPRGIAGHFAICVGKSKKKVVYDIVAPQRPAVLPDPPGFAAPQLFRQASLVRKEFLLPGFLPPPFEPPRS